MAMTNEEGGDSARSYASNRAEGAQSDAHATNERQQKGRPLDVHAAAGVFWKALSEKLPTRLDEASTGMRNLLFDKACASQTLTRCTQSISKQSHRCLIWHDASTMRTFRRAEAVACAVLEEMVCIKQG
eukprot:3981182-Pleurochrysis_carterae.AAC.1